MTLRNFSSTAAQTTLTAGVSSANTTLLVAATTGFPPPPFILAVDAGAAAQELVLVTNVAGLTLTVTRGYDSTVAVTHDAGAVVEHSHAALDLREANTHVNATSDVHGVAGALVGTTGTQTLTNKTLAAPAATGSLASFGGAWVGYAPTILAGGSVGNATRTGAYAQIGKTVHFWAKVTLGSTSTVTGVLNISLPISASAGTFEVNARFDDVTGAGYFARGVVSGGGVNLYITGASGVATSPTATTPFTWAVDDGIYVSGTYEAA